MRKQVAKTSCEADWQPRLDKHSYCHFTLVIPLLCEFVGVGCSATFFTVLVDSLDAPGVQTYQLSMNPERKKKSASFLLPLDMWNSCITIKYDPVGIMKNIQDTSTCRGSL